MVRQFNDIADSEHRLFLIQGDRELNPVLVIDPDRAASGLVAGKHLIIK